MGQIYRHYKGGIYNVVGMAKHTETEEDLVVYEGTDGKLWCRPTKMFLEKVNVNGQEVDRFQSLGEFYK
jgi:hypothetical protein